MASLKKGDLTQVNPWIYFWILLVSNSLLAYSNFSYIAKSWIFFFGVLAPLILSIGIRPKNPPKAWDREYFSLAIKPISLIMVGSLAISLRFFNLTNFHLCPTGDEGLHGFLAIPLSREWNWQFFYTVGEHPPLLIWVLSFFFRFFDSPFFNLWFFPAFISVLTVPMGYLAARQFFSKSTTILFGFLLAFSFWPMFFGRFCHQGIFIPFWECLSFWLLGRFLNASETNKKTLWIAALGFWAGLGSLTFTSWAVVLCLFALTVLAIGFYDIRKNLRYINIFFISLLFGLLPFLLAAWKEGYGHHLIDSSAASSWFSRDHQFITYLSYVTCLFWGNLQPGASYGPSWGGVLNPILDSCFFLGLCELFQRRKERFSLWLLFAFLICLLPGFLAADYVEFNRVIQVMPFLLLFTVIGFQKLLDVLGKNKKRVLLVMLIFSFGLDVNHLLIPVVEGSPWKLQFKKDIPDENFNAYQILEKAYRSNGPGLIFADFLLLSHSHSLNVLAYHLNAALNPRYDSRKAQWAALMVNKHYRDFLLKRFVDSKWYDLPSSQTGDGGMVLGIIPIHNENKEVFNRWVEAHRYFHDLSLQAENILNNKKNYLSALERLPEGYTKVEGDPFLESVFGEWLAQYHYGNDNRENILALQRAISKGYPAAHLFYKLGGLFYANGQWKEARESYLMASRTRPNYTNADEVLRYLDGLKK